ncbi:MAG: nucleotidyltransferase family protein [Pyrinomonadaceae bacterium]|nr:nucleotidyltransferase family protein [Pyrinomonadaceae bacterium]MCX7640897.1 nucleotidyltransferase family protein [Pyrinomonadaceae bacterium]
MHVPKLAIVILAAGESKRFGQPKQIVRFEGKTLLEKAIKTATSASLGSVFIVLGANAETIISNTDLSCTEVVVNPNWQLGIGSSLQAGLKKVIEKEPKTEGIIVMLCDQPLISSSLIKLLAETFISKSPLIVATEYLDTVGVPAIFSSSLFDEIFQMNPKTGAKSLIKKYEAQTEKVYAPEAAFDIDTREDYESLLLLPKSGG